MTELKRRTISGSNWLALAALLLAGAGSTTACGGDEGSPGDGDGDGDGGFGGEGDGDGDGDGDGTGGSGDGDGGSGNSSGGGDGGDGGDGPVGEVLDVRLTECATDSDALQLQFEYKSGWEDEGECDVPFLSKWDTRNEGVSSDTQIKLPLVESGSYDFWIDWGDGSVEHITAWDDEDRTHTYATGGEYDLRVVGQWEGFRLRPGMTLERGEAAKLLEISKWGGLVLGNANSHFFRAENLQITAVDAPDLSKTTSLFETFRQASTLNADLNNWDVSGVISTRSMFSFATSFDGNITDWDMSSVEDVQGMFSGAAVFNQDISGWDVRKVRNFGNMFSGASSFNQPIGNWKTLSADDMFGMFRDANLFNRDLSGWDVSSVTNFQEMFRGATVFNGNVTTWVTSSATTMRQMFDGSAFNQDISSWNIALVEDMYFMLVRTNISNSNWSAFIDSCRDQALATGVKRDVQLDGDASRVNDGASAVTYLHNNWGWNISDLDGLN